MDEVSVYRDATIHVTNLRAMLHDKTYAMANVTSVSTYAQIASKAPGILLIVIGALCLPFAFIREVAGCSVVLGLLFLLIGAALYAAAKNVYWVRIGSASGETNALSSHDRDYIQRVVNAMNEAIVRRG